MDAGFADHLLISEIQRAARGDDMANHTPKERKRSMRRLSAAAAVCCTVITVGCSCRSGQVSGSATALQVAGYVERLDAEWSRTGSIDVRAMQRSDEFRWVCKNLDTFASWSRTPESHAASMLAWRAAFLFGTDDEVRTAFELCWSTFDAAEPAQIVQDFALWEANRVRRAILFDERTSPEAVVRFLRALADCEPEIWGPSSYEMVIIGLFRGRRSEPEVRLWAAFILAKWNTDDELSRESHQFLRDAAEYDVLAQSLLFGLEIEPGRNQAAQRSIEP